MTTAPTVARDAALGVDPEPLLRLADEALAAATRAGADGADAVVLVSRATSVTLRNGTVEEIESAEGTDIGLRVFVGARNALVGVGAARDLAAAAERALAMARAAPEDESVALAPARLLADVARSPSLDIDDGAMPDADALVERTRVLEKAMGTVPGVTNSNGVSASARRAIRAFATAEGFRAAYATTTHSHVASAVAGDGTRMERDYWASVRRHLADLAPAEEVGRIAGERAVRRLDAEQLTTRRAPVLFEPRAASGFLGHLLSAANGAAVARGASLLADRRGTRVLAEGITVRDDPTVERGLASRPFDGEGIASAPVDLVVDGVLAAFLLDLATARRLGLEGNGRAYRGTGAPSPSATNVAVTGGAGDLASLMREAGTGLLVTDLIGMGANIVSGNYSRGAAGFWFENGEVVRPVAEVTIAGHLSDMFAAARFGDDAPGLSAVDAPSVLVEGLTIGGR